MCSGSGLFYSLELVFSNRLDYIAVCGLECCSPADDPMITFGEEEKNPHTESTPSPLPPLSLSDEKLEEAGTRLGIEDNAPE